MRRARESGVCVRCRVVDAEELATGKADQVLRRLGKGLSRLRDAHVVLQNVTASPDAKQGAPFCEHIHEMNCSNQWSLVVLLG